MALTLCGGALPASAQDAPAPVPAIVAEQRAPVITRPSWARPPGPEYPGRALHEGVSSGRVELDCGFTEDGTLAGCVIREETPPGMGFGAAALRGVRMAKLSPSAFADTAPGTRVRFPLHFEHR